MCVCIKRIWHKITYNGWYATKPNQTRLWTIFNRFSARFEMLAPKFYLGFIHLNTLLKTDKFLQVKVQASRKTWSIFSMRGTVAWYTNWEIQLEDVCLCMCKKVNFSLVPYYKVTEIVSKYSKWLDCFLRSICIIFLKFCCNLLYLERNNLF